jgi:hypothetical protein
VSESSKIPSSKPASAAPAPHARQHPPRSRKATGRLTNPLLRARYDFVLSAVLGGIVLGLLIAFVYGLYLPKVPWAFDRPEAQLPSLQVRHTMQ